MWGVNFSFSCDELALFLTPHPSASKVSVIKLRTVKRPSKKETVNPDNVDAKNCLERIGVENTADVEKKKLQIKVLMKHQKQNEEGSRKPENADDAVSHDTDKSCQRIVWKLRE